MDERQEKEREGMPLEDAVVIDFGIARKPLERKKHKNIETVAEEMNGTHVRLRHSCKTINLACIHFAGCYFGLYFRDDQKNNNKIKPLEWCGKVLSTSGLHKECSLHFSFSLSGLTGERAHIMWRVPLLFFPFRLEMIMIVRDLFCLLPEHLCVRWHNFNIGIKYIAIML